MILLSYDLKLFVYAKKMVIKFHLNSYRYSLLYYCKSVKRKRNTQIHQNMIKDLTDNFRETPT